MAKATNDPAPLGDLLQMMATERGADQLRHTALSGEAAAGALLGEQHHNPML